MKKSYLNLTKKKNRTNQGGEKCVQKKSANAKLGSRNVALMIERALEKAPYVKEGETGRTGANAGDGYMIYIEYHTSGETNICDYHEKMTDEHYDWKMHDCKNNEEWRIYLNKQFWKNL